MPRGFPSLYNTRHEDEIFIPFAKTNMRKFFLRISGPLIWNSIPTFIKHSHSLSTFTREYKKYLLQHT